MKAAAISAVLIASVLEGTAAEGPAAEVMPWAARLETSVFGYRVNGESDPGYQGSVYPSITVQPSRYLWMHGGLRFRETGVFWFAEPYRELGSLKVAAIAQLFPGTLYLAGAGNYVVSPGRLQLTDTSALSGILNGYSPLPEAVFLSAPGALGGVLLRFASPGGETLLGSNYYRPGMVDPFDTLAFEPAAHVSFSAQFLRGGRHAVRLLLALYGDESTETGIASHREGPYFRGAYRFLGAGNRWDGEAGASFKSYDHNRRVRLDVEPEPAAVNDNQQQVWIQAHRNFPVRKQVWRVGLAGAALWNLEEIVTGYELRTDFGWRLSLEKHYGEIRCHALTAHGDGADYLGVGFNFAYSMRRVSAALPAEPPAQ